jgi:hypothetical protein
VQNPIVHCHANRPRKCLAAVTGVRQHHIANITCEDLAPCQLNVATRSNVDLRTAAVARGSCDSHAPAKCRAVIS